MNNLKKIVCFGIFLILSFNLHSQILTRYFIEGVENVDYVTLEICVDSIHGINKVKLIEEKTTHKERLNIDYIIEYIKVFNYPKDGPLMNKCGELTFTFINPEFEKMKLKDYETKECSKFRLGDYNYQHINFTNTKIKRGKRIQKEISHRGRQIYDIKWTSNSTYILTYKRMSEDSFKSLIGKQIDVEIIKLIDDNGYVYKSTSPNGMIYYGVIYKSD